jgi:hypothetical protein
MSHDDSTPENMSKLMALGNKTLHYPLSDSNFITGKLAAIPQAGMHFTGTVSHLLLLNHEMGMFKILVQLIFKSLSKCLFQATCKIRNN